MHYQAITTKFHGPTNARGSRITARAAAGRTTVSWDFGANQQANHAAAACALAEKLQWTGVWVSGGLPEGTGDVFVLAANAMAPGCNIEPAFVVEPQL